MSAGLVAWWGDWVCDSGEGIFDVFAAGAGSVSAAADGA